MAEATGEFTVALTYELHDLSLPLGRIAFMFPNDDRLCAETGSSRPKPESGWLTSADVIESGLGVELTKSGRIRSSLGRSFLA